MPLATHAITASNTHQSTPRSARLPLSLALAALIASAVIYGGDAAAQGTGVIVIDPGAVLLAGTQYVLAPVTTVLNGVMLVNREDHGHVAMGLSVSQVTMATLQLVSACTTAPWMFQYAGDGWRYATVFAIVEGTIALAHGIYSIARPGHLRTQSATPRPPADDHERRMGIAPWLGPTARSGSAGLSLSMRF